MSTVKEKKKGCGSGPGCRTKGDRSQGGGQSQSCVLLIMGRLLLAFKSVEPGHGNRCEGGRWAECGGGGGGSCVWGRKAGIGSDLAEREGERERSNRDKN